MGKQWTSEGLPGLLSDSYDASLVNLAMPLIEERLGKMEGSLLARAFDEMQKGVLSVHDAYGVMSELYAIHKLRKGLTQTVKIGQTAGDIAYSQTNGEQDDG